MEHRVKQRLTRDDWVREALEVLEDRGVDGVKVVLIAKRLGVTSGSFYWHFKGLRDLLDGLLDYWEHELTDAIADAALAFKGTPEARILDLMLRVIDEDAAAADHAISVWARSAPIARETFDRTLRKRFEFARWMFEEAGFGDRQAGMRGRLMMAYLMGESMTDLKSTENWRAIVQDQFEILTNPITKRQR